jgi:hypothetical protein
MISLYRLGELAEVEDPGVSKQLAPATLHPPSPELFLVLISARGCVDSGARVRPEGLRQ